MSRRTPVPPDAIALFPTSTDREVQERFGVSLTLVRRWRREGCPDSVKPTRKHWPYKTEPTPDIVARFGKEPDVVIAKSIGACFLTVRRWREQRGIQDPPRKNRVGQMSHEQFLAHLDKRHPGMQELLGKESDESVGDKYGLVRARIQQLRLRIGAASHQESEQERREKAITPLLATLSDKEIANQVDVPQHTVRKFRKKAGIPEHLSEYDAKVLAQVQLLGTMSDKKAAKMIGVPHGVIFRHRHARGIPPFGTSPKCADYKRIDQERVRVLFHEGKTDAEIATALGCATGSIAGVRSRMDLRRDTLGKARSQSGSFRAPYFSNRTGKARLDRDLIAKLFHEGKSDVEITTAVGSQSPATIAVIRREELGLIRKPGGENRKPGGK